MVILLFCLVSCADDEEIFPTFLEKNNGSEWLLRNDSLLVYIRINNNEINLIEQWYYIEKSKCFDYNPNIFVPGNCTIRENSFDCFTIMGDIILSDYQHMTFTNQGEMLQVEITLDEWQSDTVFFTRSPISVDDLNICTTGNEAKSLFINAYRE